MKTNKTTITISLLLTLLVATSALAQDTERTIPVTEGTRLEVSNHAGEVTIRGWDKDEVQFLAEHGSRDQVDFEEDRGYLKIGAVSHRGRPAIVDYQISVPLWMDIEVVGPYCDMSVEGVDGDIFLETVEGELNVRGGSGHVTMRTVEGDITLSEAKGRIEVASVDGEVFLSQISGPIYAEAVDGSVRLEQVESDEVEASSVDGDIIYIGTVSDKGQYRFLTHDGDVDVSIPEQANVTITVAVVEGEFEICFPVETSKRQRGHRFKLQLGDGSARMELESFDGDVLICRP